MGSKFSSSMLHELLKSTATKRLVMEHLFITMTNTSAVYSIQVLYMMYSCVRFTTMAHVGWLTALHLSIDSQFKILN